MILFKSIFDKIQDGTVVVFEAFETKRLVKFIWRECYQKLESTMSGSLYSWNEVCRNGKPIL
jgi:hypothetical protein